jgi:predicted methyltransferase
MLCVKAICSHPFVNIDAQTASVVGLQQAMHDAVNDAIRNALKPGGLLYKR